MKEYMEASEDLPPESPEVYRRLFINNDNRNQELVKLIRYLYFKKGFKRIMVFVDRRSAMDKLKELFKNAYLIH
jgi:hypothetical protein